MFISTYRQLLIIACLCPFIFQQSALCVEIQSFPAGMPRNCLQKGFSYYLPRTRLRLSYTVELFKIVDGNDVSFRSWILQDSISLASEKVSDHRVGFFVPTSRLKSLMVETKLANFNFEKDGTLGRATLSTVDRTPEVITDVVKTAANVAKTIALIAAMSEDKLSHPRYNLKNKEIEFIDEFNITQYIDPEEIGLEYALRPSARLEALLKDRITKIAIEKPNGNATQPGSTSQPGNSMQPGNSANQAAQQSPAPQTGASNTSAPQKPIIQVNPWNPNSLRMERLYMKTNKLSNTKWFENCLKKGKAIKGIVVRTPTPTVYDFATRFNDEPAEQLTQLDSKKVPIFQNGYVSYIPIHWSFFTDRYQSLNLTGEEGFKYELKTTSSLERASKMFADIAENLLDFSKVFPTLKFDVQQKVAEANTKLVNAEIAKKTAEDKRDELSKPKFNGQPAGNGNLARRTPGTSSSNPSGTAMANSNPLAPGTTEPPLNPLTLPATQAWTPEPGQSR